jgi:RNA polymerase sigma-70 factor (ECF subfamily)
MADAAQRDADRRSDEELMRAYVGGDQEAFQRLFERYAPMLLRLATRYLRDEEQARETVQQTFFQLHAARHDFRLDAKLRPWVFTIAMNLVREHYRRRTRRKESPFEEGRREAPQPLRGPIETRQRAEALRRALDTLPESQRSVVELHWFEDKPFAEVATIVGSTEGAVRVRAHRAYKRLRELLGDALRP